MIPEHGSLASSARRRVLAVSGVAGLVAVGGLVWRQRVRQTYPATVEEARAVIRQAMIEHRMSALSVALVDGQRIVWRESFGRIDDAGRQPGPNTLFAMGSISKLVAALAVMLLVERGRIELDAPLVRYLKDFRMASPGYDDVTVRMLLAHSSGFPGTDPRGLFTTHPVPGYAAQVLQTLARQRLKHAPGEMSVYCNDGFTLVEPLVAAMTGRTYPQFVDDEILKPLGMRDSCFPQHVLPAGSFAPAYVGAVPEPMECVNGLAAGGLYSTPSDVARLAMLFMGGGRVEGRKLFSDAAMQELLAGQAAHLAFCPLPVPEVGLGWDGVRQAGLAAAGYQALHKNGQTVFYGSQLLVEPRHGLAVVLTGTSPAYGPESLAERILLRALAEKGASSRPGLHSPWRNSALPAGGRDLDGATGVYAFNYGLLWLQGSADRSLSLSRYEGGEWRPVEPRLVKSADLPGCWRGAEERSYRLVSREGRDYLVLRSRQAQGEYALDEIVGERVAERPALSRLWRERVGRRWLCVNDDPASILLSKAGPVFAIRGVSALSGHVLAHYKGGIFQIVEPVSDSRAQMAIRIPGLKGANIDDVVIERRGTEDWLRFGSLLYRPQEGVPVLEGRSFTLDEVSAGLGQWLRIMHPGEFALDGVADWKAFDEHFRLRESGRGGGPVRISAPGAGGVYLLLYGHAGQGMRVSGPSL